MTGPASSPPALRRPQPSRLFSPAGFCPHAGPFSEQTSGPQSSAVSPFWVTSLALCRGNKALSKEAPYFAAVRPVPFPGPFALPSYHGRAAPSPTCLVSPCSLFPLHCMDLRALPLACLLSMEELRPGTLSLGCMPCGHLHIFYASGLFLQHKPESSKTTG